MAYLDDHPPARSQFRDPRRQPASGVIVVHTAENMLDQTPPDTGAEGVANFIVHRDTPGSYHDLVDSDSTIHLVRYECEAYHDGTGSNPHSYGLSFALRADQWPEVPAAQRDAFLDRGARAAAAYAAWLKHLRGITIPAVRINREASERRTPGFISHAERDPARRHDPGAAFPWTRFLQLYSKYVTPKETTMESKIVWYRGSDGRPHAYQVFDSGIGKHLTPGALDVCRAVKVPEANAKDSPLNVDWQETVALMDGPCKSI